MFKKSVVALSAVLTVLFIIATCWADDDDVKISIKDYGKLSGKWWQWAEKTGAAGDPSGVTDCSKEQRGDVWFLAGTLGTTEVRTCEDPIPRGKALFFPLVNAEVSNNDCMELGGCPTVEEKRQLVDSLFSYLTMSPLEELWFGPGIDTYACQMSVTVDGVPAQDKYPIVRIQSPPFKLADDKKAIADGFWVLVPPLSKGDHTIQFTGAVCESNTIGALFAPAVTYHFTVGGCGHCDDDD